MALEFRGDGSEYFRIWIVNLLLTILTLGIFSAWAKVRRLRYFYGSTLLDGTSFEYHGRPLAILKGRLIAVVAYLALIAAAYFSPIAYAVMMILLVLGIPWIIVKARLFQSRMSSWRGIRFDFTGTWVGAFVAYVGWSLLGVITLSALWPMGVWKQAKFQIDNTRFGATPFRHEGRLGPFYAFCYGAFGMAMGLVFGMAILAGIVVAILVGLGIPLGAMPQPAGETATPQEAMATLLNLQTVLILLLYAVVFVVVGAYMKARALNNTVGVSTLGPHALYCRLGARKLMGIQLTNLLGMLCTLGLFYPWARMRVLRYQLTNTGVAVSGSLDGFIGEARADAQAAAQEVGEFFDIDFGF